MEGAEQAHHGDEVKGTNAVEALGVELAEEVITTNFLNFSEFRTYKSPMV